MPNIISTFSTDQAPFIMNTTIKGVHIEVLPKKEQRMIFMNGGTAPYLMAWNKQKFT